MALSEYEDFHALVGQPVRLRSGEEMLAGRLESVRRLPEHEGQPRPPFSVVIVTEKTDALPQQTFTVEIGAAEPGDVNTVELFLVPIGPSADGMAYEAVFA